MNLTTILLSSLLLITPPDTVNIQSSKPAVTKTTPRISLIQNEDQVRETFEGLGVKARLHHQRIYPDNTVFEGEFSYAKGNSNYLHLETSVRKNYENNSNKAGLQYVHSSNYVGLVGFIEQRYDVTNNSDIGFRASLDMFENPVGLYATSFTKDFKDVKLSPQIVFNSAKTRFTTQIGLKISFKEYFSSSISLNDNNKLRWSLQLHSAFL